MGKRKSQHERYISYNPYHLHDYYMYDHTNPYYNELNTFAKPPPAKQINVTGLWKGTDGSYVRFNLIRSNWIQGNWWAPGKNPDRDTPTGSLSGPFVSVIPYSGTLLDGQWWYTGSHLIGGITIHFEYDERKKKYVFHGKWNYPNQTKMYDWRGERI